MLENYRTTRRVEFRDTDAAGIMHFSAFFTFMEEAEHELFREAGLSINLADPEGTISWPRVSASCQFYRAVKFEDVVEIEVRIERMGEKSLMLGFRCRHDGELLAEGRFTTVCCRLLPNQPPKSIPIPDWMRQKLARWTPK